jgi:hypothetical protein
MNLTMLSFAWCLFKHFEDPIEEEYLVEKKILQQILKDKE